MHAPVFIPQSKNGGSHRGRNCLFYLASGNVPHCWSRPGSPVSMRVSAISSGENRQRKTRFSSPPGSTFSPDFARNRGFFNSTNRTVNSFCWNPAVHHQFLRSVGTVLKWLHILHRTTSSSCCSASGVPAVV